MPLLPVPFQVASVRAALDKHNDRLDEALLSNCFAWMKKCQDDRMDTMVALLQKVLQLYAANVLKGPETEVSGVGRVRAVNCTLRRCRWFDAKAGR